MIFLIFQKSFNFFWTIAVFCFIMKFLISSLIGSSNTIRNHIYFAGVPSSNIFSEKIEQSPSKLNYKGIMSRDRYDSFECPIVLLFVFFMILILHLKHAQTHTQCRHCGYFSFCVMNDTLRMVIFDEWCLYGIKLYVKFNGYFHFSS